MNAPSELYLASGNPHKIRELQELADNAGISVEVRSAAELGGMPKVVEDTGTFVGNARKKAVALHELSGDRNWVMADDSGIAVDVLDGRPGVESAYFAGPESDDEANLNKLVKELEGVPDDERSAHYTCVLILIEPGGREQVFEGICRGTLARKPTGTGGFGYDPLFIPEGYKETFGVLPAATKRALSHRAQAWLRLCDWIRNC